MFQLENLYIVSSRIPFPSCSEQGTRDKLSFATSYDHSRDFARGGSISRVERRGGRRNPKSRHAHIQFSGGEEG